MIMITRLSADNESPYGSSIRQLIFVVLGIAFGLIVPVLIRKLTFLDKWTWIYAGVGGAALLAVALFAPKSGGANLSFRLAGFSIQPFGVRKDPVCICCGSQPEPVKGI